MTQKKSNQSGQNANKLSILHVQVAVTTVASKHSKNNSKPPKIKKNDPEAAPGRPSRKIKALRNDVELQVYLQNPQEAPKKPPRDSQKASKETQEAAFDLMSYYPTC